MFLKPINVKSNNKIKASEKKQLIETFCSQYNLAQADLISVVDTHEVFRLRLSTNCGKNVTVYKFAGQPALIEIEKQLIPTVFFLWSLPDLLPQFKTHEELVPKLMNGADLMLPGVILDEPLSPNSFGRIEKGALCSISTATNRAPVAVGHTALSAYDMFMSAGRGKAVIIFHVLGDQICSLGSPAPRPLLNVCSLPVADSVEPVKTDVVQCQMNESDSTLMDAPEQPSKSIADPEPSAKTDYDEMLRNLLLLSIKSVSETKLPMPVNVFYANHILAQKPLASDVDIKKTSYKKVGVFLKAMQSDGLLVLDEPKPGILLVKSLSRDHPAVREAQHSGETHTESVASMNSQTQWPDGYPGPPTVEDVRVLRAPVSAIFTEAGYRLGDCLSQADVRKVVDQYVRKKQLQRADDPSMVQLNAELMKLCDPNLFNEAPESTLANPVYTISFVQLFSATLKRLPQVYRLRFPMEGHSPVLWHKKEPPFIHLYVVTKNGKKLTRVANLAVFQIDPDAFARRLQLLLACSAMRVDDPQYSNTVVIQAQGTHLVAISSLLTECYGINKRMIRGYTEPPKKKK